MKDTGQDSFDRANVFGTDQPNYAFVHYFNGQSYL